MPRIPLISAAYAGKSVISSGQECVNLYAEIVGKIDPQSPTPVTYYPTPGTVLKAQTANNAPIRGCYRTSLGTAYIVSGTNVYYVAPNYDLILVGNIADKPTQVYFKDNGLVVVLVDGSNGYVIDMDSNQFAKITDSNFYGAAFVELLDTFFIFNNPGTNQFYISVSNASFALLSTVGAFDPLDIAAKSGFNDPIVAIITVHRELWLVGNLTTEVWIGTGAADFYFQQVQGAYINHGCGAPYSLASQDTLTFFIQQDMQGNGLVLQGQGYDVTEISTPRLVEEFKSYAMLSDAIGFCFQIADHAFYALVFPSANKGWLYDLTTTQWCEWNWCDENGNLLRPRANCCMFANNDILVGDWQYGKLLKLDINVFKDEDSPIVRIRTFPHLTDDDRYSRINYNTFSADMQVGSILDLEDDPQIYLSWSDNKGVTYGNPVAQSLGKTGEYAKTITWNRLGQARDRVFKLQWSTNNNTALNGGFITRTRAAT